MSKHEKTTWELVVDNFAGGGGVSQGIKRALNRDVDIAVNHNAAAVAMHKANHPNTRHFRSDVFKVDPIEITKGQPVGFAWFSPDCTHFSKAKGRKPRKKKIRGLAWVMVKWAMLKKPRVMVLENVEEFQTWGPLLPDGSCCPKRKGFTFKSFVKRLIGLGYDVDWRELRACDYGAPTIRKRFFLIARRDGKPIVWPQPTHADPARDQVKSGKLKPWRLAWECIDFSINCPSIFLSKSAARKLGIKRPLVDASCARIAKGVDRYVINAAQPFIVSLTHQGGDRVESIEEPFKTITGAHRGEKALVIPFLARFAYTHANGSYSNSPMEPFKTITSQGDGYSLIAAHVARQFGTGVGHSREQGTRTATKSNKSLVIASFLAQNNTGVVGHAATEPFSTLMGRGTNQSLIAVSLLKYYGQDTDPCMMEPLHTVRTKDCHAISAAHLAIPTLTPELAVKARNVAAFLRKYGVDIPGEFAMCCALVIYDIGMRLFIPRELFNAQGFDPDFIIDLLYKGKPLTKTAQIQMCGNSVPPALPEAICRVNVPELRVKR